LGNDDASERVREISINYAETGESFDRKTIIVDSYFSATIAKILQNDPNPKTMAECKTRSDWNQWKDATQAEISSLTKRQVLCQVIPTPPQVFLVGFCNTSGVKHALRISNHEHEHPLAFIFT
jgi:hypothetical protein